ncbi:unnamed protein product [Rodentolepis nana]|uniref:ULP_PROTEASE domain-containing protein n=1 Tax=Rodentolepis nana TaxID=102285 RepID=A0A0R3TM21_RODNA|nr:unnamed protein product [Rodentolepis nana]
MRCEECESENLQLDEVTCHYVCQDCFLVTNYTEGLVYDEAPVGSRPIGLRRFGTQQSTVDLQSQKITTAAKNAASQPMEVDASQCDAPQTFTGIVHRKWRMSEAINLIFKTTAQRFNNEFLMPAPNCYQQASQEFMVSVDKHWKTYLQIIGEIGKVNWAVGFRKAVQAIEKSLDSRKAYIEACARGGRSVPSRVLPLVKSEKDVELTETTEKRSEDEVITKHRDVLRVFRHLVNPGVVWTGMNKDQGTEVNETSTTSEESRPPRKRARKIRPSSPKISKTAENIFDIEYNEKEGDKERKIEDKLAKLEPFTQITDITKLSEVYDELVKWMRLIPLTKMDFSFKQWFFRGTVGQLPENRLMEYNLGLIYLSVMDMLTKTRVIHFSEQDTKCFPIYIHEYFSMQDLATMCKIKDIPYLKADELVIQHLSWNNFAIQSVFDRRRVPDPNVLSKVTNQLIHMIGYSMRPRLPLCQMVHRYLRWMGLPYDIHLLADNWIRRLSFRVREEVEDREAGMHFYLPLQRYLRAEVFAMAIVVLSVRSMFKLDGVYESCFSKVSAFLSESPKISKNLENLLKEKRGGIQSTLGTNIASKPFFYLEWASNFTSCTKIGMKQHTRVKNEADAPIHSALLFRDLYRQATTTEEFLGPDADFNPITDLGWGEKTMGKIRRAASKETKLKLSEPLQQLCAKFTDFSVDEDEINNITSVEEVLPSPCKSCQVALEHRIFQGLDNIHHVALNANHQTWSEFNCDVVCASWEFMHENQLTVETFLEMVVKQEEKTPELEEIIKARLERRDWSYLLSHYKRYDPIHTCRFSVENDRRKLNTFALPDPVLDFLIYHNNRMRKLMAGEPVDPSALVNVYTDRKSGEDEKTRGKLSDASASLNWLIELASVICGATFQQLLEEIKCIEKLLKYGPPITTRGTKKLEDLAMAYHFNYDIAPAFNLKK